MSDAEAQGFLRAAQARLAFQKAQARIPGSTMVTWVIGFVRDAPFPLLVAKPAERLPDSCPSIDCACRVEAPGGPPAFGAVTTEELSAAYARTHNLDGY